MSFDNDYNNRKDIRNKYKDGRSFDRTCRNHNSCPWCTRKRLYRRIKEEEASLFKLKDFLND